MRTTPISDLGGDLQSVLGAPLQGAGLITKPTGNNRSRLDMSSVEPHSSNSRGSPFAQTAARLLLGLVLCAAFAQADAILPTAAIGHWLRVPEPAYANDSDHWTLNDSYTNAIDYTENDGQALVSDTWSQGNFMFTASFQTLDYEDGDLVGLVFGW